MAGADLDHKEHAEAAQGNGAVDVKDVAGQHRRGLAIELGAIVTIVSAAVPSILKPPHAACAQIEWMGWCHRVVTVRTWTAP